MHFRLLLLLCLANAAPMDLIASEKPAAAESAPNKPTAGARSVDALTRAVKESVVVVSFAGRDGRTVGLGSGFVVSKDGLIATNLHVIGEARPIFVRTADGKRHNVTEIHATERQMDLAVIRIDAKNLTPLPLGDSDKLPQGADIVALGNPRGLTFSVVRGVLSGRRKIDAKPMLQLAMPIEQGNSGGPVLDMQGRVHGLVTMKSAVTRNLGFAVAVNALKPLLARPNPVPMARWLTIGTLDAREWTTLFGSQWRQRAGRIQVNGRGGGFGGRSLCLWEGQLPELPFEVQVQVKLEDEAGAAGLVVHSDGENKHYGFYPSNGSLRFSRFDGPDVFSWNVLRQVSSKAYRGGEWNTLKLRVEENKITGYVNDQKVVESTDGKYGEGKIGFAKFRETEAEFKGFRIAKSLPPSLPTAETIERIAKIAGDVSPVAPPTTDLAEKLLDDADATSRVLEEEARKLEAKAKHLRMLAKAVHETKVRRAIIEEFQKKEADISLLKGALLVSRLDNEELDVDAYLRQVDRMSSDLKDRLKPNGAEADRIAALDDYLFRQLGYHGSRTNYYHRSNSYLNEVIDDREGLPIMLSVLYMELARRLDVNVVGVGLPGKFVVRFEPKNGDGVLIDPFEQGARLTTADAEQMIKRGIGRFDADFLKPQPKRDILVRVLRNLMNVARDEEDPESMLRYVDTMVALDDSAGVERWFRAVLRYQTDRNEAALKDIEWVLTNPPEGVELQRVRQLQQIIQREQAE